MSELKALTLDAIKYLNLGIADEAFQRHLQRCAADCIDRPLESAPRKILLQVAVVPDLDENNVDQCDRVKVQIQLWDSIPKRRTKVCSMATRYVQREGRREVQLVFNADSLENVDQTTLLPDE